MNIAEKIYAIVYEDFVVGLDIEQTIAALNPAAQILRNRNLAEVIAAVHSHGTVDVMLVSATALSAATGTLGEALSRMAKRVVVIGDRPAGLAVPSSWLDLPIPFSVSGLRDVLLP